MRLRWTAIAALSALLGLCFPGEAAAQRRGWLERLSGPGPFDGWVIATPVVCFHPDAPPQWTLLPVRQDNVIRRLCIDFAYGWYGTDDEADQPADPALRFGDVNAKTVDVGLIYRLHPAITVGAGAGFIRFSGDRFDAFNTLTLMPVHVVFRPFELGKPAHEAPTKWRRLLSIDFKQYIIPARLTGADFGVPANPLNETWEPVSYWSVGADLSDLLHLFY